MKRDELGTVKTYRRHYCSKKHRTYSGAARCLWSRNVFRIEGDGPYVLVHRIRDNARPWKTGRIIELYKTEEDLARVVGYHSNGSCCGSCRGYDVVRIDLENFQEHREAPKPPEKTLAIRGRASRTDAQSVSCPKCGAKPYDPCIGSRNNIRKANHQDRVNHYRRGGK